MQTRSQALRIKLVEKEFEVEDDFSLITNNLEFLGFATVVDRTTGKRTVFTTSNLILIEELD